MKTIRVACVRYLNTIPLIEGLEKLEGVALIPTVPSRIADMVRGGEADVGLVSLIDAWMAPRHGARNTQPAASPSTACAAGSVPGTDLALLPVGMIGCDGPTLTVRLFSAVPLDQVAVLHADTDSHTSIALAQVLLWRLHGIRPRVVSFDARERVARDSDAREQARNPTRPPPLCHEGELPWPETVLLIGDKVVTDAPPAERYPHQLDLGDAWHRLTGLPMVYAMWMCRAADVAGAEGNGEEPAGDHSGAAAAVAALGYGTPVTALESSATGHTALESGATPSGATSSSATATIRTAAAVLDRQLRHNLMRLEWLIARRAPEHRWPPELARRYLGELLRYRVGAREREAVDTFIREAARLGLVEPHPPVWASAAAGLYNPPPWLTPSSPAAIDPAISTR